MLVTYFGEARGPEKFVTKSLKWQFMVIAVQTVRAFHLALAFPNVWYSGCSLELNCSTWTKRTPRTEQAEHWNSEHGLLEVRWLLPRLKSFFQNTVFWILIHTFYRGFYRGSNIRPDESRLNNGACWLVNIRKWPNHFWLNHIPFKLR